MELDADAVQTFEVKAAALNAQADAYRDLSGSFAHGIRASSELAAQAEPPARFATGSDPIAAVERTYPLNNPRSPRLRLRFQASATSTFGSPRMPGPAGSTSSFNARLPFESARS